MKLEVNIEKRYAFVIVASLFILAGAIVAYAYGTNNPSVFGHSADEVAGVQKSISNNPCPPGQGIIQINADGTVLCYQAYLYNLSFFTANGANTGNGLSIGTHDFCFLSGATSVDGGSAGSGTSTCRVQKISRIWYIYSQASRFPEALRCDAVCVN